MLVYDSIVVNGGFLGTNRKLDSNGYLRVKTCNITKEQVAPYLGKEIPNWESFGLDPDKVYYVYRPEKELEKAVESFDNLPLTREHIEVDVENVPKEKIVGSLGDRAEYKRPYVKNSLIVYDQKDIDWIMSGKKRELSCGYRYTPVRESGEFNGQHYDFVMTDIVGNHVALVKEGRAGHDVMVADEKPDFSIEAENGIIEEKEKEMFFDGLKKMLAEDEFKESEHPREKNGQFTSKGGEGSGNKEESSKISPKIENHLKEKITGWYKNAKQDYDVDGEFLGVEEKINSSGGKDLVIKYKEDGKELKSTIGWYEDYTPEQMYDIWMEQGADDEMVKDKKLSESEQEKVGIVMKEFKDGELKSGSGKKVTDPKQALAIGYSEAEKAKDKEIPDGQDKPETAGEEKADKEKKMEEEKKESLAEDKCAKDEDIDKRKLIDEIGGILKGKVDEELIRTIIGKAEKIAYEGSEAGEADDEKDLKGKEKEAFAEGVEYGEKNEKEEPKKLDSEHESEGMEKEIEEKKAEDKCSMDKCDKKMAKDEMTFDIDAIKEQVRSEVMADFKARDDARKAVKSVIGDVNVMAFDSCEEIYKLACEKAGMNVSEIASYKDAFAGFMSAKSRLALDAAPISSGNEECLKNIRV